MTHLETKPTNIYRKLNNCLSLFSIPSPFRSRQKWSRCNAYRYLAGEWETVGWTLLFAVAVVVAASTRAHCASAGHLPFPSLVRSLSGWFSYRKRKKKRSVIYSWSIQIFLVPCHMRICGNSNGQTSGCTWRCNHSLPLLEEAGLQAVSGAQAVGFMSGHQLLHGLQNHTKLLKKDRESKVWKWFTSVVTVLL